MGAKGGAKGGTKGSTNPVPQRQQKRASAEGRLEEEEEEDSVPKKARLTETDPLDLTVGTAVIYWGDRRGTINDAYIPLDEFWVSDRNGDLVRDEHGGVVQFKANELELVAPLPSLMPTETTAKVGKDLVKGGILVFGTEDQMMKILEHFGSPDENVRHNPQQLLAIPCNMCELDNLQGLASDGVEESIVELAKKLREDIYVAIRASQLKHALQELGPDLVQVNGYYCLSAVQIPYGWEDIEEVGVSERVQEMRKEIWNQIDLCPTAIGEYEDEALAQGAARRSLRETCRIEISNLLWSQNVQTGLRRHFGIEMQLMYEDPDGVQIVAIILPEDAIATTSRGLLRFSAAGEQDFAASGTVKVSQEPAVSDTRDTPANQRQLQGKTVRQWEAEQAQFAEDSKLPAGWIRVKSRSTGEVYYFNKQTQQSSFKLPEEPLPDGWTKQVSKSTGKTYWFNARKKMSTFTRPTE